MPVYTANIVDTCSRPDPNILVVFASTNHYLDTLEVDFVGNDGYTDSNLYWPHDVRVGGLPPYTRKLGACCQLQLLEPQICSYIWLGVE